MKKKILTLMLFVLGVVLGVQAEAAGGEESGTPAITFEAGSVERTVTIGLNAAGTVKVDWGDGTLVEQTATQAYDGWDGGLEFTGTPSGTVKIYGDGIAYFQAFTKMVDGAVTGGITSIDLSGAADITELDIHQNNLTSVDLSSLAKLEKLTIGVNDMTGIDLSANTELTTFDANCTSAGNLTSLDLSKNTKLATLKANFNKLTSLDLSKNTSLKNIYLLNNELTSIDFGENTTAKIYISLNNNKLESLDVTAQTGLSSGTLFLMNNNLTELKHGSIKTLNITGNRFALASLYETSQNVTTLTSASMQDYQIPGTIEESIDLSSQATVNGVASTIVWKTVGGEALVEGTDYTVEDGVYTFIKEQTEQVYAEMSNSISLPKLTTPIKTTTAIVTVGGSTSPAISFVAGSVERTVTIGLNAAGTVKVDWGDGTLVEQTATQAYDGWDGGLEFTGTPSGTVKIYGDGIAYFQAFTKYTDDAIVGGITSIDLSNATTIAELDLHQNSLSAIDLSKQTGLTSLTIGVNDFETIDLSANTELTTLDISDSKNTGKLTSIDLSNNTKLTKVVLSGNKLTALDLSKNPLVKTLTVLNNSLTSVTFGENTTSKHTINLGGNKLSTIDLTGFANYSGTYLRVRDNELSEIVLPGKIGQIWADGNAFTLSQLYALKSQAGTLTYATTYTSENAQQPMEITADGSTVDLSSEAVLGETATAFVWKTTDGTALVEGTDYTVEGGVFTFLTSQTGIHCEMTNAELPNFTSEKPFLTVAVDVVATGISEINANGTAAGGEWYNLAGQKVSASQKGVLIRNGKKYVK